MKTVYLIVYLLTSTGSSTMHIEKVESQFVCNQLGKAALEIRHSPNSKLLHSYYRCVAFRGTNVPTASALEVER